MPLLPMTIRIDRAFATTGASRPVSTQVFARSVHPKTRSVDRNRERYRGGRERGTVVCQRPRVQPCFLRPDNGS